MNFHTCPGANELESLAIGDVSESAFVHLIDHVLTCDRCDAWFRI